MSPKYEYKEYEAVTTGEVDYENMAAYYKTIADTQANIINRDQRTHRLMTAVIIGLLVIVLTFVGAVYYLLSSYDFSLYDSTQVEQYVEGEDAQINNVKGNQYKDNGISEGGINNGEG